MTKPILLTFATLATATVALDAAYGEAARPGIEIPGYTEHVGPERLTDLRLCGVPLALVELHERGTVLWVGPELLKRVQTLAAEQSGPVNTLELSRVYPGLAGLCQTPRRQSAPRPEVGA